MRPYRSCRYDLNDARPEYYWRTGADAFVRYRDWNRSSESLGGTGPSRARSSSPSITSRSSSRADSSSSMAGVRAAPGVPISCASVRMRLTSASIFCAVSSA